MRSWRLVWASMFVGAGVAGAALPAPEELRGDVAPYLLKPLPSVVSLVGIPIPDPSPMLVVASFGDRSSPPDGDRGFALGRALNELLFGAHRELDVETPFYYALDTADVGVVAGRARDSRANAYRVAVREGARWCVHGAVDGIPGAYRVVVTVDGCVDGSAAKSRTYAVDSDADWPRVLNEACDYVIAVTTNPTPASTAACARGAAVRPQSFVTYAALATSGRPFDRMRALVAQDPAFAPAVIELLDRMSWETDKAAFLKEIDAIITRAGPSPAVAMRGYGQQLARNAWKREHRPFDKLAALIRAHPQLRGPWMLYAASLSQTITWDHPSGNAAIEWIKDFMAMPGARYYPNEATHTAGLAVSLDYYARWPQSYRAKWQMGHALQRYAYMVRGHEVWRKVPPHGKASFYPLMSLADEYIVAALKVHAGAPDLWTNRIVTAHHTRGDAREVFDTAAALHPTAQPLYDTAMIYAHDNWGGSKKLRDYLQETAIRNNPGAEWARTLIERHKLPSDPR